MAQIIDEPLKEVDDKETSELVSEEVANVEEPQPELPEQYQGKTPAELVKMHQEAESRMGSQGEEVGQLRKIVDDFILKQSEVKEQEKAEEIDFFAEPDKAVEQKIANHPTIKQLEELGKQMQQSQTLTALQQKHPDMKEIAVNPEFQKWVVGSEIRKELYNRANSGYDYNAADELFNNWKSTQETVTRAVETERKDRKQTLNAASTGSANGSSETSRKKIYRRADIIELMKTNPKRYVAMEEEFLQAYAEKRVR